MKHTSYPMSMIWRRLRSQGLRPQVILLVTLLTGIIIAPGILATPVSGTDVAPAEGVHASQLQDRLQPTPATATPAPGPGTSARLPGWAFLLLLAMIVMFIVIVGLVVLVALRAWYVRSGNG